MTSTNDGKDVKSYQTSVQKGKTYYIELYKSLDARLSADTTGEERTQVVCEAWRRVHSLCQHSAPETHPHLLAWLQRHTSYTILHTDWPKASETTQSIEQHTWLQEAIDAFIAECREAIAQRDGVSPDWESQLLQRAHWFLAALSDPWGHPVLKALLNSQEKQLTDEQILEWLKEERGVTLVTRLRQLAGSRRLHELALRLASAVMDRARASQPVVPDVDQGMDKQSSPIMESPFVATLQKEAGFKAEVWNLLTDIEFVLLHSESRSRCIELAKQTPLHKGYNLVKRLQSRLQTSPRDKKIWKNAKEVATLIAQVIITRCMVVPTCSGPVALALDRCAKALVCLLPPDKLPTAAAALAAPARTSAHLHMLATAVHAQCKEDRKSFVCELYVRAITAGMNELETLKLKTEKESEARYTEQTLSNWFTQLGSLLSASSRLSSECILTAFSVHPSPDMYDKVRKAPLLEPLHKDIQEPNLETNSEYGSWANDSRTQTNLVKTSETLNLKSEIQANVLSTAIFAEGETLGLKAELCQDLAVLISGPRVKTLTWDMDRESLLENCRTYMERTHGGTRALTTELKYLNLDPRSFQHLPEEEDDENDVYYGIEKGYEHLVEKPDEDLWEDDFIYEEPQSDSCHCTGESAIDIPKRKKKSKRYFEEEVDPLSFEETKRPEKQDRPHSKERRKEKKHKIKEDPLKDTDQSKEHSQEKTKEIRMKAKKKERKERKKKEKIETVQLEGNIQTPQSSLSRLVGMKVERKEDDTIKIDAKISDSVNSNLCITDSDYDSQGKSSINSEGNDPNVLFDGLFSMEEIKSPERAVPDNIQRPMLNYEANISNSVLLNKTIITPNAMIQSQKPHTISVNTGKETIRPLQSNSLVKKSIKKLLEFRKNKAFNEQQRKGLPPTIPHPVETNSSFNLNSYPNNLKQSSHLSNMPKTYLSNDKLKQSNALTDGTSNVSKNYSHHVKKVVNETFEKIMPAGSTMIQKANHNVIDGKKLVQYSPYTIKKGHQHVIKQSVDVSDLIQQVSKQTFKPTTQKSETPSQNQFTDYLKQRSASVIKKQPTKSCVDSLTQIQFQEFLRQQSFNQSSNAERLKDLPKQYQSKSLQNLSRPILSTNSQMQHQNFLKELRESANAGATMEKSDIKAQQITDKTGVKQVIQQKKVANALNTFSRRNYLHKNKQSDKGFKPTLDQTKQILSMSMEDMKNLGVDYEKVTNLHTKGEIVISKIDRAKSNIISEGTKIMMHKPEVDFFQARPTPLNLNKEYPIMAQILSNKESFGVKTTSNNETKNIHARNVTPTSNLSEKDQNDLVLLLRQQSKMNAKLKPKTEYQNNSIDINSKMLINSNSVNPSVNANNVTTGVHSSISDYPSTDNFICPTNHSTVIKSNDTCTIVSEQKKGQNVKVSGKCSKQTEKSTDCSKSDWESVMNALLAHKTPSRGPNALDIVLKKDSFDKRLSSDSAKEKPKATTSGFNSSSSADVERNNTKKHSVNVNQPMVSSNSSSSMKKTTRQDAKPRPDKKVNKVETSKKAPSKVKEKSILSVMQNVNDPFISGTPNSDFDLLGDLMDDDLRQEIGELLADDEAYGIPVPTPKPKNIPSNDVFFNDNKTNIVTSRKPQIIIDSRQNVNSHPSSSTIPYHHDEVQAKSNSILKPVIKTKSSCITTVTNPKATPRIISNDTIAQSTIVKPITKPYSNIPCKNMINCNNNMNVSNIMNVNSNLVLSTNNINCNAPINVSIKNNVDIPKVETTHFNIIDPTPVVLVPQTTPKVMLISNELIYNPFPVPTVHQNSTNYEDSTSYVALNQNPQSITLFRTPSYPVILDGAVSVPVIQKVPTNISVVSNVTSNTLAHEKSQMSTYIKCEMSEISTLEKPVGKTYGKCEKTVIKSCIEQATVTEMSKTLTNSHDINSSKLLQSNANKCSSENVVVEEVPKLFNGNKPTLPPKLEPSISKLSLNSMSMNIANMSQINTLETNKIADVNKGIVKVPSRIQESQSISPAESTSSIVKYLEQDNKETVLKDQLRIQQKRMLILNRQTHYYSKDKPIALLYEPIKVVTQSVQLKSTTPEEAILIKHKAIVTKDDTNVVKDIKIPKKSDNEIQDNTENNMNNICQEIANKIQMNKSNLTLSCRRILLRSSNNLKDTRLAKSSVMSAINNSKESKRMKLDKKVERVTSQIEFKKKTKSKDITDNKSRELIKLPSVAETKDNIKKSIGSGLLNNALNVNNTDTAEIETKNQSSSCIDIEEQIPPSVIHNTSKEKVEKPLSNQNTLMKQKNTLLNIPLQDAASKISEDHSNIKVQNSIVHEEDQSKFHKASKCNESIKKCSNMVNNKVSVVVKSNKKSNIKSINKKQTSLQNDASKNNKSKYALPVVRASLTASQPDKQQISPKHDEKTKNEVLLYKDKIMFEELPNISNDPLKKFVRIKLPNGSSFKATISGKLNVTIDAIFEEPSIKAVILRNINDNKKCTLNVKQVTVKSPACASTVTTHIQDMSYSKSHDDAETINLLSDDEDNNVQTFKTEFGNFNSAHLDDDIILKHQEKFSQKCVVKIIRCKALEKFVESKLTTDKTPPDVEPESSLPNLIEDCIEIDDSSNDSVKMPDNNNCITDMSNKENYVNAKVIENVDRDLSKKDMLLKDLEVIDNSIDKSKCTVRNEDHSDNKTQNYTDTSEAVNNYHEVIPKECILRIDRCDDLVEKMKIQKNSCFVALVRCDNITKHCYDIELPNDQSNEKFEDREEIEKESALQIDSSNIEPVLQRSESLSILNDFSVCGENQSTRSSPSIMDNFDIPLILSKEVLDFNDFICCAEWLVTKSILREFEKDVYSPLHEFNYGSENDKLKFDDKSTDFESDIESIISTTPVTIEESNQFNKKLKSDIKKSKFDDKLTDCESDIGSDVPIDTLSVEEIEKYNIMCTIKNNKANFDDKFTDGESDIESNISIDHLSIEDNIPHKKEHRIKNDKLIFYDKSTDCESDIESIVLVDCSSVKENGQYNNKYRISQVPSLIKIVVNFFQNNSDVIDRLKSIQKNCTVISSSSPLKRKFVEKSFDKPNNKISKLEKSSRMLNFCKTQNKASIINAIESTNTLEINMQLMEDIDLTKSSIRINTESDLKKDIKFCIYATTPRTSEEVLQIIEPKKHIEDQEKTEEHKENCIIDNKDMVTCYEYNISEDNLFKIEGETNLDSHKLDFDLIDEANKDLEKKQKYLQKNVVETQETNFLDIENMQAAISKNILNAVHETESRNALCSEYKTEVIKDCERNKTLICSDHIENKQELLNTGEYSDRFMPCRKDLYSLPEIRNTCEISSDNLDKMSDTEIQFNTRPISAKIDSHTIDFAQEESENLHYNIMKILRNNKISDDDKIEVVIPLEYIGSESNSSTDETLLPGFNDDKHLNNIDKHNDGTVSRNANKEHDVPKINRDSMTAPLLESKFGKVENYEETKCTKNNSAALLPPNKISDNITKSEQNQLENIFLNNDLRNKIDCHELDSISIADNQLNNTKPNNENNNTRDLSGEFDRLVSNNELDEKEDFQNQDKDLNKTSSIDTLHKNVTLIYKGDSSVVLNGSIYEDPVIGTCYVFPIVNRSSLTGDTNVCDDATIKVIQAIKNKVFENQNKDNINGDVELEDINLNVIVPKITYSKQTVKYDINRRNRTSRINLKRKIDAHDNKFCIKRYRKGKNIDYPKFTVSTISESGYGKEYKNLFDYWSSIKFSFSRPFHKEHIDVFGTLKCWPTLKARIDELDGNEYENLLFLEDEIKRKEPFDPLTQTLSEEISSDYIEPKSTGDEIKEINFSMGFGEGSDRVIQNSEDGDKLSKFSAATLSDVKQCQPFLLSEDYCIENDKYRGLCRSKMDEIEISKRFITYIKLRDKIRSFFEKTTLDLQYNWGKDNIQNKNDEYDYNNKSLFPYDVFSPDFIEPAPIEITVNVVQVGQLPVSAAAQNPVTCDPRVTQVTDASPSQCSAENSANEDSQSPIKTEYTELTTADISLPIVQEYERQMESQESSKVPVHDENIPVEIEVSSEVKSSVNEDISIIQEERNKSNESDNLQVLVNKHINNIEYSFESNDNTSVEASSNSEMIYESMEKNNTEYISRPKHQNGSAEKTDQIAHAMSAAGITTSPEPVINSRTQTLVNMFSPKMCQDAQNSIISTNNFTKTSINTMTLHQALAQILPPPLNQTNSHENNQVTSNSSVTPQVVHIVQGKNTNGNQITVVENTQNSVISNPNTLLHIVQNKSGNINSATNSNTVQHTNSYSGLSLVDSGLQQGNNQLLHIVNTGSQKNNNTGQLLKRVNLLTNLANIQGSNEQKMVQFVCKSADGKSIQLNAPHQRSMVLRLQPFESPNIQNNSKTPEAQDLSPTSSNNNSTTTNKETINAQHEIKSRSVYEENYAKFIQSSTNKTGPEKSTSLPKFNQAFGKQVFQDGNQKTNDINTNNSHLASMNADSDNSECQSNENTINLDHITQISSPPLLLRKSPAQTTQTQSNIVQQIKQTIAPMMHGGVIYTRQIPVNIGGGQTINLITVPSTELVDDSNQKQQGDIKFVNQNDMESPIIKIVSQNQSNQNTEITSDESNNHTNTTNENNQNPPTQHQPVLTQMRIKLPMLSKTPQMVSGARVVRPSFFQIQRNVIGGANQPVYQQLVLTAAPPLGQHTIRLPHAQARQVKVTSDSQSSSESQMSTSTLEQLREFDMVLEQVKERSTVQPNSNNIFSKLHTSSSDTTDSTSITCTVTESTQQVLYSIGANQSLNVAYVNRKPHTPATTTTAAFVRSPDSSSIIESPSSSTHAQIPHTVTSESASNEVSSQQNQPKAAKIGSKSKSRPKSSHPPNSLKINTVPPKTSTQKPLEDEQTTQRILYILAEYKEQVENSPDKDKPAPRRRTNPPSNPSGSSKRKKSSSSSRRSGARDSSPVQGDDTCRTMGSEDSSCGTSQGDCTENCLETHSPQDSPRKVVRKLTFENETTSTTQPRPQPQRNVIVADGQTITVARGAGGKPATAVLMPANYILPVSMVKGGQQIAIVTNRGPKLLTVGGGEGGTTNALLLQRLIGPAGLKPVLARPGVRHVRLPTAALHNLQPFNLATATTVHPPDSAASPAPAPTPPELIETRASSSPWADRESQDVKPERGSSPEGSEPWHLTADPNDYSYEETVRTENMDRTVLDAIPDRYSPDMEAQRIFDKMFDVDSKKSYIIDSQDDSSRCAYDIDASDCDDKAYHQVVQKKDGHRQHRLAHVSAAALRHKYAILEHELRLQKSLSEECEDLGVDSPSASELFPEAELLFSSSPAHEAQQHSHTPQPTILNQSGIPQPDIDDQIATDHLLHSDIDDQQDLGVTLGLDEGIVTVSEDGMQATIALDQEEFARSHPNTTFHSEPTDEGEVQPFTISGLKGRHITSTIFHAGRAPATVLVTAPQTTVISQASQENIHSVKYANIDHIINSSQPHRNLNLSSVLVKDDGLTKFDNVLTDSRELHLSNTASAIVHSTGNATQVIRRVCYEDDKRDTRYLMDESDGLIAGDDAKMIAEDSSRDATLESIADGDEDNSSPERHAELFWESNSASERSESRRPIDYNSSDSEKCCKSPFDETNSTDSSGVGTHMRLDSVIKEARLIDRAGSGSSDDHPPLRTYPAKRMYHNPDGDVERSLSGKTRAGFQEDSSETLEGRRRASGRGVVKRGCHCCNGSPVPPRPKKPKKKPTIDFTN
ncbi:unnamed protein product, partial [Brenthis ino]